MRDCQCRRDLRSALRSAGSSTRTRASSAATFKNTWTRLWHGWNPQASRSWARPNARFSWDSYRRFIQMYGNVVLQIEKRDFDEIFDRIKEKAGAKLDTEIPVLSLQELVKQYKALVKERTKMDFPEDPRQQLQGAINAVFGSWRNPRAIHYRRMNKISEELGTAVNVQTMVFGNMGNTSGTGVGFTRNPSTGEREFYGEFLINAQGEDV